MRSHAFFWAPVLLLPSFASLAHADTLQTFSLQADYADTVRSGTVSGSLTIDTTTGSVLAGTYDISGLGLGLLTPTSIDVSVEYGLYTIIDLTSIGSVPTFFYDAELLLPVPTLVGYNGGLLCTTSTPCGGTNTGGTVFYEHGSPFVTGSLTLANPITPVTTTPEPSSFALLGTGALSLGLAVRRRLPIRPSRP